MFQACASLHRQLWSSKISRLNNRFLCLLIVICNNTIKSKQTRIFKNFKNWVGIDHCYKSKETRNNILIWDIFKSLVPTFGLLQWVNMIKACLPKVRIKLLKISNVRILFLASLLFIAVINPYSVFKFLIFKWI